MALLKAACEAYYASVSDDEVAEVPAPAPPPGAGAGGGASLLSQGLSSCAEPARAAGVVEDDEQDDEEDDERADGAPPPTKKKKIIGSFKERWDARCVMCNIHLEISLSCRCERECVSQFSAREVYEARQRMKKLGSFKAIREWLRTYLIDNKQESSAFGHDLHLEDKDDKVCVAGFEVYYGFAPQYLYKFRDQLKKGIAQDDPNLGGRRHTKVSGSCAADAGESSLCDDDSIKYMSAHGWWKELREDIEHQPNTRERQIDFIQIDELYGEYVQDQRDAGATKDAIASQVSAAPALSALARSDSRPLCSRPLPPALARALVPLLQSLWSKVWHDEFDEIKIREHKAVDGKDKIRAELRRLLRRTVTKNATDRAHIKELRQQYRASLRRERSEYWGARLQPGKFPEEWMTNISDGATQKCVIFARLTSCFTY